MVKTLYLNLEDDIPKIVAQVKREKSEELVLVFPKRSFLFSDSINMRLLKKQLDLLGKSAAILTMDERGQIYAKEAGFKLKFLPKTSKGTGLSDVRRNVHRKVVSTPKPALTIKSEPVKVIKKIVKNIAPAAFVAPSFAVTENIFSGPSEGELTSNLHKKTKQRTRFFNRTILGFSLGSLLVIFLLVVIILPKGDITIYPRTEPVARDIEINLSVKTEKPDSDKLALPASYIERKVEMRDKFSASGKRDVGTKAEGSVALYNLTGKPLNLKSGTTTLSVGNKNYYFKTDQEQIRPATESGSGQAPTVAEIVAGQAGEEYNLPAGTRVEVTNQVFGSKPQQLYAKTQTQVIGGTSRFVSVITEKDVTDSYKELTNRIAKQLNDELASKNMVLPDGAYSVETFDQSTDKQAGIESPTFEAYENVNVKGLAFNKKDLTDLIRSRISRNLGTNKELEDATLDTVEIKIKNLDMASQTMTAVVHFESQVISKLDLGDIKSQIAGKSKQEASEILLTKQEISRVDITLSPGWQRSIPRLTQKINLQIKSD